MLVPQVFEHNGNRYYNFRDNDWRIYRQTIGWIVTQPPSGWLGAFSGQAAAAERVTRSGQFAWTGTQLEVAALAGSAEQRHQFLNLLFDLGYGPIEVVDNACSRSATGH